MKKILLLLGLSLIIGTSFADYFEVPVVKKINKTFIKSHTGTFLGMDCTVDEYKVDKSINLYYISYDKNFDIVYNDRKEIETKYKIKWNNYNKLVTKIGNDVYYVSDGENNTVILYKNDKFVKKFKNIYGIGQINGKLYYFGLDLNNKNFYYLDGNKQYSLNNYKVEKIKKIGNDLFILYSQKFLNDTNYYLYQNGKLYIKLAKKIKNFGVLKNGSIYVLAKSKDYIFATEVYINKNKVYENNHLSIYKVLSTKDNDYILYIGSDGVSGVKVVISGKIFGNKGEELYKTSYDNMYWVSPNGEYLIFMLGSNFYLIGKNLLYIESIKDTIEEIKFVNDEYVYILASDRQNSIIKNYLCKFDKNNPKYYNTYLGGKSEVTDSIKCESEDFIKEPYYIFPFNKYNSGCAGILRNKDNTYSFIVNNKTFGKYKFIPGIDDFKYYSISPYNGKKIRNNISFRFEKKGFGYKYYAQRLDGKYEIGDALGKKVIFDKLLDYKYGFNNKNIIFSVKEGGNTKIYYNFKNILTLDSNYKNTQIAISRDGTSWIVSYQDNNGKKFIVKDGKQIQTNYKNISQLVLSYDGKNYAFVGEKNNKKYIIKNNIQVLDVTDYEKVVLKGITYDFNKVYGLLGKKILFLGNKKTNVFSEYSDYKYFIKDIVYEGDNYFIIVLYDNNIYTIGFINPYISVSNKKKLFGIMTNIDEIISYYTQYKKSIKFDGYKIVGIMKNSSAEKAGLKVGDKIIKLDGVDVNTLETVKDLKKLYAKDSISITILRDGKEKTFSIKKTFVNDISSSIILRGFYIDYDIQSYYNYDSLLFLSANKITRLMYNFYRVNYVDYYPYLINYNQNKVFIDFILGSLKFYSQVPYISLKYKIAINKILSKLDKKYEKLSSSKKAKIYKNIISKIDKVLNNKKYIKYYGILKYLKYELYKRYIIYSSGN